MPTAPTTIAHVPGKRRSALTLIELLVVLVILVILTAVAVTSMSAVVDQGRYNATQQTLQNIQDAIVGPANERSPDGSLLITGFVADMGRLPQPAFNTTGVIVGDPLRELWDVTAVAANSTGGTALLYGVQTTPPLTNYAAPGGPPYGSLYYPAAPLPMGYTTYNTTTSPLAVTGSMACGWRGPYLQLPVNSVGSLVDGWGNTFQSLCQVPGSTAFPLPPLPASGTTPAQPINVICSFGADNTQDTAAPTNPYNQDQYIPQQLAAPPIAPLASFSDANRTAGTVTVVVKCLNTPSGGGSTYLSDPLPVGGSDAVEIVLFQPVNGVLAPVYGVNALSTSAAPHNECFPLSPASGTPTPNVGCTFSTSIGPRTVQAFQFDTGSGNVSKRSPLTFLTVPPGGLSLSQTLILQ